MCQTGSRKIAADGIDIDQLHYLNAECPFWVFNRLYISMSPIVGCINKCNANNAPNIGQRLTTYATRAETLS